MKTSGKRGRGQAPQPESDTKLIIVLGSALLLALLIIAAIILTSFH